MGNHGSETSSTFLGGQLLPGCDFLAWLIPSRSKSQEICRLKCHFNGSKWWFCGSNIVPKIPQNGSKWQFLIYFDGALSSSPNICIQSPKFPPTKKTNCIGPQNPWKMMVLCSPKNINRLNITPKSPKNEAFVVSSCFCWHSSRHFQCLLLFAIHENLHGGGLWNTCAT